MAITNEPIMPLAKALHILAGAHTRDDDLTGFTVENYPDMSECMRADYIEAWESVRHNIGRQTRASGG